MEMLDDEFWQKHTSWVNRLIGQLTVPAAVLGDPNVKEVHQGLIEFARWVDDELERACE